MLQKEWTDIFIVDENYGWAVSSDGSIVGTSDGGDNWLLQNNPTSKSLKGVSFKDNVNGIIVGSLAAFLKTTDGGSNWISITQSVTEESLYGLSFVNEFTGWIAGDGGVILKTSNSGYTWEIQNSGITERFRDIFFKDELNGWAVGEDGKMVWTTDGGDLWNSRTLPIISPLSAIEFCYYPIGWTAAGDALTQGQLFKSTNGGSSWNIVPTITLSAGYYEIEFTSSEMGWIMASNGTSGGEQHIYRTTDGGDAWEIVLSNYSDTTYKSIYFLNDSIGWLSTLSSTLFYTSDSGVSWLRYQTPSFSSIFFRDALKGWGSSLISSGGLVYYTMDGGKTWTEQQSLVGSYVNELQFFSDQYGWGVGGTGNIIHTTNGGVTYLNESEFENYPDKFFLSQNYPNPFNNSTKIKYNIPYSANVIIKVYDVLGKEVITLVYEEKQAGSYEVDFDGNSITSGIYFYSLRIGNFIEARKMIFLK